MWDTFRDSAVGQIIRALFKPKSLAYPEEVPGFVLPPTYNNSLQISTESTPSELSVMECKKEDITEKPLRDIESDPLDLHSFTSRDERSNPRPRSDDNNRNDIIPVRTKDGVILVTWYNTDDDIGNPQQWSTGKKLLISAQICAYTFAVYIGSSLYVAGEADIMARFKVSEIAASLGLALYALAYGIGPMLWSPLSEIPTIGRNPIYIATYLVFVALCVATSLVDNFAGLLVLRFLLGFFGSPCLATGAASLGDMFTPTKMPYAVAFWAAAATLGPALGPVVSGFAVAAKTWRWGSWELLWLSGPTLLVMLFFLPETSHDNILLTRARRLRRATGRQDLQSQAEITFASKTAGQIATEALIKPWEINCLDPAVLFTTFYTALVYGIFYSFFESFPLVYPVLYGFNLGQTGLPFLVTLVALAICVPAYSTYIWYVAEPAMLKTPGFGPPESRLVPGLYASFLIPVGCFMFAWAARPSVHWIVTVVGVGLNMSGTYTVMQSLFIYLPFTYPQYSASLFAANDLARSSFAAGAILFARPMFHTLTLAGGVSLLGGLAFVCIGGIFVLYWYGAAMRARSRFAVG